MLTYNPKIAVTCGDDLVLAPLTGLPRMARARGKISVHDGHTFGHLEMKLSFIHPRVKFPICKPKFNLHPAGIYYNYPQQLSILRIQLEQCVGTASRRSQSLRRGRRWIALFFTAQDAT